MIITFSALIIEVFINMQFINDWGKKVLCTGVTNAFERIVWRKVPTTAKFFTALLDLLLIGLEYYCMAEKRYKFQSIWHSSFIIMDGYDANGNSL